jgi:hypothetical protein
MKAIVQHEYESLDVFEVVQFVTSAASGEPG